MKKPQTTPRPKMEEEGSLGSQAALFCLLGFENVLVFLAADLLFSAPVPWKELLFNHLEKAALLASVMLILGSAGFLFYAWFRRPVFWREPGRLVSSLIAGFWIFTAFYYNGVWLAFMKLSGRDPVFVALLLLGLFWALVGAVFALFYGSLQALKGKFSLELCASLPFMMAPLLLFGPARVWNYPGSVLALAGALGAVFSILCFYTIARTEQSGNFRFVPAPALAAVIYGLLFAGLAAPEPDKPLPLSTTSRNPGVPFHDVLIISVDTLRADELGCYGNREGLTPAIDRLAGEGTVFLSCHSPSPWTLPSLSTLMTGLYPSAHRGGELKEPGRSETALPLPEGVVRLPQILQGFGFSTAAFITNRFLAKEFNLYPGFRIYQHLFLREPLPHPREAMPFLPRHVLASIRDVLLGPGLPRVAFPENHERWLYYNHPGPAFTWIHFLFPHHPYEYHPEFKGFYQGVTPEDRKLATLILHEFLELLPSLSPRQKKAMRRLYQGEVKYMDRWVGRALEALRLSGRYDQTLIIFTADHGEEFWDHHGFEHGHTLYEELIHVPLIIKMPGGRGAGMRVSEPVGLVDILPTILDFEGISYSGPLQGRSLLPLLEKHREPRPIPPYFSEFILYGREKKAVIMRGKKLVKNPDGSVALYDLLQDPAETKNIKGADPQQEQAMLSALESFLAESRNIAETLSSSLKRPSPRLSPQAIRELRALGYLR